MGRSFDPEHRFVKLRIDRLTKFNRRSLEAVIHKYAKRVVVNVVDVGGRLDNAVRHD